MKPYRRTSPMAVASAAAALLTFQAAGNADQPATPDPTNETYAQLVSDLEKLLEQPDARWILFTPRPPATDGVVTVTGPNFTAFKTWSVENNLHGGMDFSGYLCAQPKDSDTYSKKPLGKTPAIIQSSISDIVLQPPPATRPDDPIVFKAFTVAIQITLASGKGQLNLMFTDQDGAQKAVDLLNDIKNCGNADIDWSFIGQLEGDSLTGSVPDPNGSQSGVTIATGVDLGSKTADIINAWGISDDLKAKLLPYAGLKGQAAQNYLNLHPLTITQAEGNQLDSVVQSSNTTTLIQQYNAASPGPHFVELPTEAQTVIMSVGHQFGQPLSDSTPRFWADVIRQKWDAARTELLNFDGPVKPSRYQTRRTKEAALLAKLGPDTTP